MQQQQNEFLQVKCSQWRLKTLNIVTHSPRKISYQLVHRSVLLSIYKAIHGCIFRVGQSNLHGISVMIIA